MNRIHPTAIIGDDVKMGDGNIIGPNSFIYGNVKIGNENIIGPFASIGNPPQHTSHDNNPFAVDGNIEIGDNNIIREFSTIHHPTIDVTKIGDGCYIMSYSLVNHDCTLGNKVTMSPASLAGHTRVMEGVIMGLKSMTHQFTTIGAYAMIGMGAVVVKDIPPGAKVVGNPARFIGWNTIGFERNSVSKENLDQLKLVWQKLRREGRKKITINEN